MGERSEAQKKADKAYYEKVKGQKKLFGVMLSVEEIDHIREVLDAHGIGNAELIRRAVARLERLGRTLIRPLQQTQKKKKKQFRRRNCDLSRH